MKSTYMKPVPLPVRYEPMGLEARRKLLPKRNVNSLHPAQSDLDAFLTGNGRQRIDLLGDPYHDRILYQRERLSEPKWTVAPEPPKVAHALPEARKLLRQGEFGKAADLMNKATKDAGYDKYIVTQPHGVEFPLMPPRQHAAMELLLEFGEGSNCKDYLRYLDMLSGELTVRCDDSNGGILRRAFVSFRRDAVVQEFKRLHGGRFDVTVRFVEPGGYGDAAASHDEPFRYQMGKPEKSDMRVETTPASHVISCAYNPEFGSKGFCCATAVKTDGTVSAVKGVITVKGATSVLLITRTNKVESGYKHEYAAQTLRDVQAIDMPYDKLLEENRAHIEPMMGRSRVSLGGDTAMAAEELLNEQRSRELSPMLLEKLYDMGRFFMIIDTGDDPPSWGQHNINTNLQVCAGNETGLPEVMEKVFEFFENKFEDFRLNAKNIFGARGVLGSIHCDYDSGRFYQFSRVYPHYCWTACLGWIWNEFWGHWLVTGDREFLKNRVVPGLREIALFYLDYCSDTDENGKALFYPSYSAEDPSMNEYHAPFPSNVHAMNVNSLMDVMVCREVLDNLMHACDILGLNEPDMPKWKALREKLPDYLLDEDGAVKEWSFPLSGENYNHRHVSHHYDVWPGREISPEKTPELVEPFLLSNRKRSHQDDSCHGVVHRYFTAVRLGDQPDAVYNLRTMLEHGYVTRSLYTMHYPYRLQCPDLIGSMPAVVLEMLVYSDEGFIKLLPAVPEDLRKGSVEGVWLYTFAKIEKMEWDILEGRATVELSSLRDQTVKLSFPIGYYKAYVNGGLASEDGDGFELELKKDSQVKLVFEA